MEYPQKFKLTFCFLVAVETIFLVIRGNQDLAIGVGKSDLLYRRQLVEILDEDKQLAALFPLTAWDYFGFSAAIVGLILAAGGGVGGGGILVPIYILVLQFPVKHAIPLSNVTVFGGAVANTILNSRKRHPNADRPLVDWDLILVMEPLTMAGALVGADMNKLLPEAAIVIMLVVLLGFTAHTTLLKAHKMHEQETHEFFGVDADSEDPNDNVRLPNRKSPMLTLSRKGFENNGSSFSHQDPDSLQHSPTQKYGTCIIDGGGLNPLYSELDVTSSDSDSESSACSRKLLVKLLEEERFTPWNNVLSLAALFIAIAIVNVLKGGGSVASPVGIKCGSAAFWATEVLVLVLVFAFVLRARSYLVKRTQMKKEAKYEYVVGDIPLDSRATLIYPAICSVAGVAAGLFGIGGGIVKGPLMLAMGVHPAVASATSACMILFTSSTATTTYAIFGLLNIDYAIVCASIGFLGTLVGQTAMHWLLNKYQRNSYIAFSIGIVVAISAVLLTVESVVALLGGGSHDERDGFCGAVA